jgi:1-deoxy-D-xylulose 5-phosphate reductoisomerase
VAVERFLAGSLDFTGIPRLLEAAVERFGAGPGEPDIDALIALDADVRATYASPPAGGPA